MVEEGYRQVPIALLQKIINYMAAKPYHEVYTVIPVLENIKNGEETAKPALSEAE